MTRASTLRRAGRALLTFAVVFGSTLSAAAGPDDVVLLPTVVPGAEASQEPLLEQPDPADARALAKWARELDAVLHEAAQDLGLNLDVSEHVEPNQRDLTEDALVARASNGWVISPRLSLEGRRFRVRLVAVAPGSRVVLVRTLEMEPREVNIRAMVMLRDLVQVGRGSAPGREPEVPDTPAPSYATPARSQGRAVLAVNSAAFGGYVGFSLQRASGSSDDRLTYPLIALGTGIGLGGSMIIADEWDVGLGDAWYLSAGAWWPTLSGVLLAESYGVEPAEDRYMYGLLGAAAGVSLATASLSFAGMGEGGATLTHSGGAFGLLLGGATQLAIEGTTESTPTRGMGYGAGAGVVVFGALATKFYISPSRVLLIDLGATLGGLTGAAATSPLVFGDERTEGKNRAFLASVGAGVIAGGTVAYLMTRPGPSKPREPNPTAAVRPWAGMVGETRAASGNSTPAWGGGVFGFW
ncbi:MAG: hypothetical protein R3B13_01340 [Polyangiaceae bacterium]